MESPLPTLCKFKLDPLCSALSLSLLVPTYDQWHESTMKKSQQQKAAANVTDCNRGGDHIGEDPSSAPEAAPHLSNSAKMAQHFLGTKSFSSHTSCSL